MSEREHGLDQANPLQYQGWANYPTWAVHLWLANTEGLYENAQEILVDAGEPQQGAQHLRQWVEDQNPVEEASMYADILGWALQIVDWDTVARALGPEEWDEPPAATAPVT